jgi:hypothetical protein
MMRKDTPQAAWRQKIHGESAAMPVTETIAALT